MGFRGVSNEEVAESAAEHADVGHAWHRARRRQAVGEARLDGAGHGWGSVSHALYLLVVCLGGAEAVNSQVSGFSDAPSLPSDTPLTVK